MSQNKQIFEVGEAVLSMADIFKTLSDKRFN
jgi:hypothetical protein